MLLRCNEIVLSATLWMICTPVEDMKHKPIVLDKLKFNSLLICQMSFCEDLYPSLLTLFVLGLLIADGARAGNTNELAL